MVSNLKAGGRKAAVVVTPVGLWPHMLLQNFAPDFYQTLQMSGFFPGSAGQFFARGAETKQSTMLGTSGKTKEF